MNKRNFERSLRAALRQATKKFRSPNGKAFDSQEELDEYQRGWVEYKQWCVENHGAIKHAATIRSRKRKLAEKVARETPEYLAAREAVRHRAIMVKRERQRWKDFKKKKKNGGRRLDPTFTTRRLEYQKGRCHYCGCDIRTKFEVDHWMPVALGGVHEEWNLVLACSLCNGEKSDQHPVDFEAQRLMAA